MCQPQPIDNLLHTTEAAESARRADAELKVEDPQPEKVLGVLTAQEKKEEDEPKPR